MRMTTTIIIVMAMMTLIIMSVKNNHCDDDELAYNCANRIFESLFGFLFAGKRYTGMIATMNDLLITYLCSSFVSSCLCKAAV